MSSTADRFVAPTPADEDTRMQAVKDIRLLMGKSDEGLQAILRLATEMLQLPMAAITVLDGEGQWLLGEVGLDGGATAHRSESMCSHTIMERDLPMIVPDAAVDPVFRSYGPNDGSSRIRFYAGYPICVTDQPVGAFCVLDNEPHDFTPGQLSVLSALANLIRIQIQLRLDLFRALSTPAS